MKTSRFIKWANYVMFILLSLLYWMHDSGSLYMFDTGSVALILILAPIFTMVEVAILIDSARLEDGNIMDGAIMSMVI